MSFTLGSLNLIMKNILILVAMESEEKAILGDHVWTDVVVSSQLQIHSKTLVVGDHKLSVMRTGVGQVNAGIAVSMYTEKFPVDGIILLGVGGAISKTLKPGETVAATSIIQHDSIISTDQVVRKGSSHEPRKPTRVFGFIQLMAPGELFLSLPAHERPSPVFSTHATLNQRLYSYLSVPPQTGLLLSGNEFVGSKVRKKQLNRKYPDALLVDMEAAAVAQISSKLNIPFAVLKTTADSASPKHTSISSEYLDWISLAAKKAKQIIDGLLGDMRT